jgi:aminoglycoside 6'-N-acetyltransferase I
MIIQRATKKDIEKIAKLMLEEFRKPPFNEKASFNDVLGCLNFYFKIGNVYVAINKREIIGVIIFKIEQYWEGQVIIIEDLAIKEEHKNQSIGKYLINTVEDYSKKNKIKRILFKTNKKSSSIKFYQKVGYKPNKNTINFEKKLK